MSAARCHASVSVAAGMGRRLTLNRGSRPYGAAAARTCPIRSWMPASGSPQNAYTSACLPPTRIASADAPPK